MRIAVIHHNDADGRCSAAIVHAYLMAKDETPHVQYIEASYDKAATIAEKLAPADEIFILDFSFKPEDMEKICSKGKVTWIDHHITAIERAEEAGYDELLGIRCKHAAACELTWLYFFPELQAPEAVSLIGDRDTWKWLYRKRSAYMNAGLGMIDQRPSSTDWANLVDPRYRPKNAVLDAILQKGQIILEAKGQQFASLRKNAQFYTTIDGHTAKAINSMFATSEAFGGVDWEIGGMPDDVEICCRFFWNGRNWTVSLYSQTVDVSEIAKALGGGGHKGAAGFTSEEMPDFLRYPLAKV